MTRRLKPQFKDMQLCAHCHAPAEILGEPWTHDGILDWYAVHLEVKCSPRDRGAQQRTRKAMEGRRAVEHVYHVRVYTHICTRNSYEDARGERSEAPEHIYACGALMSSEVVKARYDDLTAVCFEESDQEHEIDWDSMAEGVRS